VVEEFIPEHELLFAIEALVTLHNKYSDGPSARNRASSSWSSVSARRDSWRNTAKNLSVPNRRF